MICYMPFTSLEVHQKRVLSNLFGAVTVFAPAEGLLVPHMRSWVESGELDIRYPASVDETQLIAALEEYKAWAELHQGSIGDMAEFFRTAQGRIPMMEETNPTQIGHQIRHYGESRNHETDELLFKACLFLSMAQEYDAQQLGMVHELDEVNTMEEKMLKQLSGDPNVPDMGIPSTQIQASSFDHFSPGPYMTSHRVRAWSRLALDSQQVPLMFATLSKEIVETILETFTDAEAILEQTMSGSLGHPIPSPSRLQQAIEDAASNQDLKSFEELTTDDQLSDEVAGQLTVYKLVGISPDCFLTRMAAYEYEKGATHRSDSGFNHSLIGWISP